MARKGSTRHEVVAARVYDEPDPARGTRVLVDRLWPRGTSKERAQLDEWMKDVAPTQELRTWYGHDPARFPEFSRRYADELHQGPGQRALEHLVSLARQGPVTFLTATRDLEHSGAAVLGEVLRDYLGGRAREAPPGSTAGR